MRAIQSANINAAIICTRHAIFDPSTLLEDALFVYTSRLVPEMEGKYIRQESEKFKQESGYVTFLP
jgi:hypothetical protein